MAAGQYVQSSIAWPLLKYDYICVFAQIHAAKETSANEMHSRIPVHPTGKGLSVCPFVECCEMQ